MKLSIVTSLYCSEQYVNKFYQLASDAASQITDDYELILVNDGSPDRSLDLAINLSEKDPHVTVLDFSRNFGHHRAFMAGLEYSSGDKIFLIDSDLEEDPLWLIPFNEKLEKEKCDVVYGVQEKRRGKFFERWSGFFYYKIFNWLADVKQNENCTSARLMTKQFVKSLLLHRERIIIFNGLCSLTGFTQLPFVVTKKATSPTTYTLSKKINLAIDSITSFSDKPLKLFFRLGFLISIFSLLYIISLIIQKIFFNISVDGWTSIIVSLWFLCGIIIMQLGVVGIYIAKVFIETKARPPYLIKHIYNKPNKFKDS